MAFELSVIVLFIPAIEWDYELLMYCAVTFHPVETIHKQGVGERSEPHSLSIIINPLRVRNMGRGLQ